MRKKMKNKLSKRPNKLTDESPTTTRKYTKEELMQFNRGRRSSALPANVGNLFMVVPTDEMPVKIEILPMRITIIPKRINLMPAFAKYTCDEPQQSVSQQQQQHQHHHGDSSKKNPKKRIRNSDRKPNSNESKRIKRILSFFS